jgi:spore coat protein U-like protein
MRARIGVAFLALAFSASADQANMDVGVELIGICRIRQVNPIDFGDLEQSATSPDRTAIGSLHFWCSKGLRYNVKADDGLHSSKGTRRMKGHAATNNLEFLSYDLRPRNTERGIGLGPDFPEVFEMEAAVKGENYDPLSVGPLRDIVVVTISP